MHIVRDQHALLSMIGEYKKNNSTIAFVPTMGALHEGHLTLIDSAKEQANKVVVSIFVNPTQFGEGEDFSRYPREEEEDIKKLEELGVAALYIPAIDTIYPEGAAISIKADKHADILCGSFRPWHFDGVLTVVHRLLEQVQPDSLVLGEKDYQQVWMIRRMIYQCGLEVEVITVPTVREVSGLAMSSRNAYLSEEEKKLAPSLYQALQSMAEALRETSQKTEDIIKAAKEALTMKGFVLDYLEIRDGETLNPSDGRNTSARIFVAAYLGNTRLIDNIAVMLSP